MDIILTAFAGQSLVGMTTAQLDLYDSLLDENDQDLYQWVTGQVPAPDRFRELISDIAQTLQK